MPSGDHHTKSVNEKVILIQEEDGDHSEHVAPSYMTHTCVRTAVGLRFATDVEHYGLLVMIANNVLADSSGDVKPLAMEPCTC